jgi:hypothetical protein
MKAPLEMLLATTALAFVMSMNVPASAQVYGDGWQNPALGAFALEGPLTAQQRRNLIRPQVWEGRMRSPNPAFDVYDTQGRYIGSDPDPFIRNDLARNPPDRDD